MTTEKIKLTSLELIEALTPAAGVLNFNGAAMALMAVRVASLGKPVGELTLDELARLDREVDEEYNRMFPGPGSDAA